jgi:hypothetical protein
VKLLIENNVLHEFVQYLQSPNEPATIKESCLWGLRNLSVNEVVCNLLLQFPNILDIILNQVCFSCDLLFIIENEDLNYIDHPQQLQQQKTVQLNNKYKNKVVRQLEIVTIPTLCTVNNVAFILGNFIRF